VGLHAERVDQFSLGPDVRHLAGIVGVPRRHPGVIQALDLGADRRIARRRDRQGNGSDRQGCGGNNDAFHGLSL
jgi:hypothetical protein